MKSLQDIKDEVAREHIYFDFEEVVKERSVFVVEKMMDDIAKRYALEVTKEALKNACAATIHHYFVTHDDKPIERHVLEELINNENNIPELI